MTAKYHFPRGSYPLPKSGLTMRVALFEFGRRLCVYLDRAGGPRMASMDITGPSGLGEPSQEQIFTLLVHLIRQL